MHIIELTELETLIRFNAPIAIFDVRKPKAREADPALIAGAVPRPYDDVPSWTAEVTGKTVVCYCVHGHEVSQAAVMQLRRDGVDAYYLRGGLDGWKERSGALTTP